jgi:hypothetical protein
MRPPIPRPAHLGVRRRLGLCGLFVSLFVFGHAAFAAEGPDEADHWAPSFALFFDVLGQKAHGGVTTGPVLGPPLSPNDPEEDAFADGTGCLRRTGPAGGPFTFRRDGTLCASGRANNTKILPDDEGHDTSIVPLVGASLELMTPSLLGEAFLRPRLFAHVDVSAAFAYERNLAGVESPKDFAIPEGLNFTSTNPSQENIEELAIVGQGSRTHMQVDRWVYSGGAGIAFSADLFDRRIRIKPSIEYLREDIEYNGVVHRAVKRRTPTGVDLSSFYLLSMTQFRDESYDGIGPGLELEVDAARLGPFVSSVFFMGRGYYLFGEFDIKMTQTNQFNETATWTVDLDRWAWRSGVGFRVRWSPETD